MVPLAVTFAGATHLVSYIVKQQTEIAHLRVLRWPRARQVDECARRER